MKLYIALVLCSLCASTKSDLPRIRIKDGDFVDDHGRVLIFRGINSIIKHYPWYDPAFLDPARHQQLVDWGFNALRLGAMWTGVEPAEGEINTTYIGIVEEIVNGLGSRGIYSFLDMHQDVLYKTHGSGYWGIPEWVSDKFSAPEHPWPWPMENTDHFSTWACGYFTQEISHAFGQWYSNVGGTADSFANFWKILASRFKENTAILGYELINEPWPGDIYQDASTILPGNAGQFNLVPFYEKINAAIRSVDDETLVFWEPVTYGYFVPYDYNVLLDGALDAYLKTHNFTDFLPILEKVCGAMQNGSGSVEFSSTNMMKKLTDLYNEGREHRFNILDENKPSVLGPGFTVPPGGPQYLNRTVMSWHYYCWAIGYGASDGPYDNVTRALCDDFLGEMVFNTVHKRSTVDLKGSASMLTEFGICEPNYNLPDSLGNIECNFVLGQADKHLESWTYWDTASGGVFWDGDGNPKEEVVKVFSRPYPVATAGKPISINFDHQTGDFTFEFIPSRSMTVPTVIYVPPLHYGSGYNVTVSEDLQWAEDANNANYILVTIKEDANGVQVAMNMEANAFVKINKK